MHKENILLVKNIDKILSVLLSITMTSLGIIVLLKFPQLPNHEKINFWLVTMNYFLTFLLSSILTTAFMFARLLFTRKWDMSWLGVTLSLFHPLNFFIYILFVFMGIESAIKIKETLPTILILIELFFGVYKLSFMAWFWCCVSQKTSPHFLEVDSGAYSIQGLHLDPMVLELEESLKD